MEANQWPDEPASAFCSRRVVDITHVAPPWGVSRVAKTSDVDLGKHIQVNKMQVPRPGDARCPDSVTVREVMVE
jgi:hypothetical protein